MTKRFKVFYRTRYGKLLWEHLRAIDAETAGRNFTALAKEIGETVTVVRVEEVR